MYGVNASVFDSSLYSSLFTTAEMKHIWSDENLIASWLTYESAIARVQADLGLIPPSAAVAIEQVCQLDVIDWPRLAQETTTVGMAIKPLVDQLAERGGDEVKKYLHWGCTTQDLLDTSLAMRIQQTLMVLRRQLVALGDQLASMANAHRQTVMVARTNAMDALPTTWGLHVSGYLLEISRHLTRLNELSPRATTGMYGGAVGNLSSIGERGLQVRQGLFARLSLPEPLGLGNASMDNVAELIQCYALIHGTLGRIANDTETMGRVSIGELREGEENGDSSTMPHKGNPRAANTLQTLSRMGWMYASGAPNLMDQQDVRSASMRVLNWSLVPEASLVMSAALDRAERLIQHLMVDKARMLENFSASRHFVMSEAVMMKMAEKVGRKEGYAKVKAAIARAPQQGELAEILKQDAEIAAILTSEEIDQACDPKRYLGCNDALIEETLAFYRQVSV